LQENARKEIIMIAIASDHGGYVLKQELMAHLEEQGIEYKDLGTYTQERCDYPVYAEALARAVAAGAYARGVLVCGTGIGMSIAANKVKGARCALCGDCYSAEMSRAHNNANILALGGRVSGPELAKKILDIFLTTEFLGGRHALRVAMCADIEERT